MWKFFDSKSLIILREITPRSGIKKTIQYLLARGCSKDFHTIAVIKGDLKLAGFSKKEIDDLILYLQSCNKKSEFIYENETIKVEISVGSPGLQSEMASLRIQDNISVSAFIQRLEKEWNRTVEKLEEINDQYPDPDAFNDRPIEELDSYNAKVSQRRLKLFESMHAFSVVWKNLQKIGIQLHNFEIDEFDDYGEWLDEQQDRKEFDDSEGFHYDVYRPAGKGRMDVQIVEEKIQPIIAKTGTNHIDSQALMREEFAARVNSRLEEFKLGFLDLLILKILSDLPEKIVSAGVIYATVELCNLVPIPKNDFLNCIDKLITDNLVSYAEMGASSKNISLTVDGKKIVNDIEDVLVSGVPLSWFREIGLITSSDDMDWAMFFIEKVNEIIIRHCNRVDRGLIHDFLEYRDEWNFRKLDDKMKAIKTLFKE